MNYKNKRETYLDHKRWGDFIRGNHTLVDKRGLPLRILECEKLWTDFLMPGYLDHHDDPMHFSVNDLNEEPYRALRELVTAYFGTGYSYFTPIALRAEDISKLRKQFSS